jgi:hypothetical protein
MSGCYNTTGDAQTCSEAPMNPRMKYTPEYDVLEIEFIF